MRTARMFFAVTAIALMTAPAIAKQVRHHHPVGQNAYGASGGVPFDAGAYHRGPDPDGVYFGNEEVGRDPDPNVRQQLQNDYGHLYGW